MVVTEPILSDVDERDASDEVFGKDLDEPSVYNLQKRKLGKDLTAARNKIPSPR
jgi:hypothetical protein